MEIAELAKEAGMVETLDGWVTAEPKHCEGVYMPELKALVQLAIMEDRNRLADELEKMPLNDTAASIAIWIRSQE